MSYIFSHSHPIPGLLDVVLFFFFNLIGTAFPVFLCSPPSSLISSLNTASGLVSFLFSVICSIRTDSACAPFCLRFNWNLIFWTFLIIGEIKRKMPQVGEVFLCFAQKWSPSWPYGISSYHGWLTSFQTSPAPRLAQLFDFCCVQIICSSFAGVINNVRWGKWQKVLSN